MKAETMQIEPLSGNMNFFQNVAKLKFHEFSYLTGNDTIEDYLKRQHNYTTERLIPRSYVVLNESQDLLGTFTLKLEALRSRPDLSPWLDSLVVVPMHRRKGVGVYIVNQAKCLIKELGYSHLYLYTPDQEAWYAKQGWQLIEKTFSGKFPVSVMSTAL